MINITQITSSNAFDALQADWQRLAANMHNLSVFNTWHWNRLWWKHYAHLGNLFIVVISIDNTVQCIAPFYLSTTRALRVQSVSTLRFLGSGGDTSPDDLNIIASSEHYTSVLSKLCQYLLNNHDIKRYELRDIPEQSPFLQCFVKQAAQYNLPRAQRRYDKRLVDTLPTSIAIFLSTLSRNTRKHWRRRQRQLNKAGVAQYQFCQTPKDVERTLIELTELHRTRRASLGDTGSFESKAYIRFHKNLMLELLERGELRLLTLKLNGKTIGIEYAFQANNILCFFQTGFDPAFNHLSPGHLLMTHLIETAIGQQATGIDLLKGRYDYKASYAKQTRTTVSINLWRNPLVALCYRLAHKLKSNE